MLALINRGVRTGYSMFPFLVLTAIPYWLFSRFYSGYPFQMAQPLYACVWSVNLGYAAVIYKKKHSGAIEPRILSWLIVTGLVVILAAAGSYGTAALMVSCLWLAGIPVLIAFIAWVLLVLSPALAASGMRTGVALSSSVKIMISDWRNGAALLMLLVILPLVGLPAHLAIHNFLSATSSNVLSGIVASILSIPALGLGCILVFDNPKHVSVPIIGCVTSRGSGTRPPTRGHGFVGIGNMMRRRLTIAFSAIGLAVLLAVSYVICTGNRAESPVIATGMERDAVIRAAGQPRYTGHSIEDIPDADKFVPTPSDPVEKEVLVFGSEPWRLYVYIDDNGIVDKCFLTKRESE